MILKRFFIALLALLLAGCGGGKAPSAPSSEKKDTLTVVSTVFAPYDFVRELGDDAVSAAMLLPPGAESHSYEPTPQDIIRLQNCDLFIFVGGESDQWVWNLLDSFGENRPETLVLLDCVDPLTEETVEGMQTEPHSHDHDAGEAEYDEHVWTSPQNAKRICAAIAERLTAADAANADRYAANLARYNRALDALDADFAEAVAQGRRKLLVFGDRFPFRYFTEAYGLEYLAAFPGCSNDVEPSAATIAFLTDKVRALEVPLVLYLEFSNHRMADAIAESTGAQTAMLHSCHNVSHDEMKAGASYLSLMQQNVQTLRRALA